MTDQPARLHQTSTGGGIIEPPDYITREEADRAVAEALAEGERAGRALGKRAGLLLALERVENAAAGYEEGSSGRAALVRVARGLRELVEECPAPRGGEEW